MQRYTEYTIRAYNYRFRRELFFIGSAMLKPELSFYKYKCRLKQGHRKFFCFFNSMAYGVLRFTRNPQHYAVLLCVIFLSACTINTQQNKAFRDHALGTNVVNEECHLKSESMLYDAVEMPGQLFNIYCGDWEWPSARIFKVDAESSSVTSWRGKNVWQRTRDRRMVCDEDIDNKVSFSLPDTETVVFNCKLHNGGWPYLALIIQLNDFTYLVDGIPSSLVAVQKAVSVLAGKSEIQNSTHLAATEYLHQQYKGQLYSTSDLQAYYRAMTLGQYYNSIKSFAKAEAQYWQAITRHQQVLGADNSDTADALMHIALELSNQEQFARADDLFVKAENKVQVTESSDDSARFDSYHALHFANQGQFQLALNSAILATNQRHKEMHTVPAAGSQKNNGFEGITALQSAPAEVVQSLYIEAAMQERLGNKKESKRKLEQAQYILSSVGEAPPLWEPQTDNLSGVIAFADQQQVQAENVRIGALSKFEKLAPGKRPTMLSLLDLGKLYFNQKKGQEAVVKFRAAVNVAKKRSNSFRLRQLEPYFLFQLENQQKATENGREVFEAAQLVQGSITAKEIARTVARFGKKAKQQNSLQKHKPIIDLIGQLQKQEYLRARKQQQYQLELGHLLEKGHLKRLQKLTKELDTIDQQIDRLNHQVQTVSPGYRQLISSAVNTEDVINALTKDEALLQVLVGEQQSYVFFIRKNQQKQQQVIAYSVAVSENEISETVDLLRRIIAKGDREVVVAAESAFNLYNRLFAPIVDEINNVSHLITVPSGPLLSFPFELFVTKPALASSKYSHKQLAKIAWLVKTTTISLLPSAQSFVYLRQHASHSTASKSLIAFGDFMPFTGDVLKQHNRKIPVCQAISEENDFEFLELKGTRKEIKKVAAKFKSVSADDLFFKTRFTEEAVKSQNLKDYRVVYFATHALLPDQIDCRAEPSLITSINTQNPTGDDGFLTTTEIADLDLNADLVVLSACNTGGAYQARGESLSGLARSFFFAGTRSLLVSHWNVHDDATAELMILVFDFLKKKPKASIANALKMAQMKMLTRPRKRIWAHPYYWAAFSLVGDGGLKISTDSWTASR